VIEMDDAEQTEEEEFDNEIEEPQDEPREPRTRKRKMQNLAREPQPTPRQTINQKEFAATILLFTAFFVFLLWFWVQINKGSSTPFLILKSLFF
jgi:hypothetical protein